MRQRPFDDRSCEHDGEDTRGPDLSADGLSVAVRADAALPEAAQRGGSAQEEVVGQLRAEHVVQHAQRHAALHHLHATHFTADVGRLDYRRAAVPGPYSRRPGGAPRWPARAARS